MFVLGDQLEPGSPGTMCSCVNLAPPLTMANQRRLRRTRRLLAQKYLVHVLGYEIHGCVEVDRLAAHPDQMFHQTFDFSRTRSTRVTRPAKCPPRCAKSAAQGFQLLSANPNFFGAVEAVGFVDGVVTASERSTPPFVGNFIT